MSSTSTLRRVVATAAATAGLLGGALAVAPAASASAEAAASVKCTKQHENYRAWVRSDGVSVNLRTGPGTGYTSLGLLSDGTAVTALCSNKADTWEKVRVLEGRHKGKVNWVYSYYVPTPMNPV